MAIERSYIFGVPESERVAQEESLRRLRGSYRPWEEEWFARAIRPITGQLQRQGLLTSGGAPEAITGVGMDRIIQMRHDALSALLGIGARQREADISGTRLGLERYGLEGGWGLQREMEAKRRELERYKAKKEFWASLIGSGAKVGAALISSGTKIGVPLALP